MAVMQEVQGVMHKVQEVLQVVQEVLQGVEGVPYILPYHMLKLRWTDRARNMSLVLFYYKIDRDR